MFHSGRGDSDFQVQTPDTTPGVRIASRRIYSSFWGLLAGAPLDFLVVVGTILL